MPDQFATGAMPRVVLLARAGKAADNIADALRQAGAELLLSADPAHTDEAALRAHDPQVVLVALEPSIESALEKFDELLMDPALTVIYDEADLAAHRAGWDAARWVRHLSAKLRRDTNVLPPGTESDHDWQPSPGQIPKPAAAYSDMDLAMFTREAAASAHSVPSDGMPVEFPPALKDMLSLDNALFDAIPEAHPVPLPAQQPPPLPPVAFETESIRTESFELVSFEALPSEALSSEAASTGTASFDAVASPAAVVTGMIEGDAVALDALTMDEAPAHHRSFESVSLDTMQIESMELENIPLESMTLESMTLESMPLQSMPPQGMRFDEGVPDDDSAASAASDVVPMHLDDDAFFLEELSTGDSVSLDSEVPSTRFDGGFDTDLDFEDDAEHATAPVAAAPRVFEEVLSFESLIADSMTTAEAVPVPAAERIQPAPHPALSLEGLSLAPVDESPAVLEKPAAASHAHDLSALEARISSLSLVDLDDGPSEKPAALQAGSSVIGVVLVEAGLGGPDPARQLLSSIPAEFPAVVLVRLHLQGGRYDRLVAQMQRAAALPVALAQNGAGATPGTIYFLPDGIGLAAHAGGLEFTADGAGAESVFDALPAGDSAVVFLSGSDMQLVDTAMTAAARGTLVIAQSAEDCYDGAACAELRKRGAVSGLPAELAGRLASRWPS